MIKALTLSEALQQAAKYEADPIAKGQTKPIDPRLLQLLARVSEREARRQS